MKTIATIFFIFFIGTAANAQNNTNDVEVTTFETVIVTETVKELNLETKKEVARLYKFKNARIKKALSFTTKRNKAKLA